jgi:outer membrane protein assembly factor BamB
MRIAGAIVAIWGVSVALGAARPTSAPAAEPAAERFWAQWRGPYATGVSRTADPPIDWSETKNIRWKVEIPGRGSASPVVWGDRLYVLSAVPAGLTGAASHAPRGGVQPRDMHRFIVMAIGILYLLKTNSGILSAFDAKTGKPHYQLQRLDGLPEIFASPVGAQGRVYVTGRDGVSLVIRNAPTFEVLAKNTLEDGFDASPALVDNEIYLRGYKSLYCIAAR